MFEPFQGLKFGGNMRDDGRFEIGHKKIGGFVIGSRHSIKSKHLISNSLTGIFGERARRWKGNEASYVSKHMWI
jgi:hypothetical protein